MNVRVNESCIGCGLCAEVCPDVFEMNDENVAIVKVTTVAPEKEDDVRQAADGCPVEAIEVDE